MVNDQEKYFVFNGKKSSDFGVWASELSLMESPAKRVEIIEVAGRNGDIIIEDGSYENVNLKFKDCFIINDFAKNFSRLKAFLYRQKGYKRLETPWLPDEYRLAEFDGDISPTIRVWEGFGKFDITFNCKPQRFLKVGDDPIIIIAPTADMSTTVIEYPEYGADLQRIVFKMNSLPASGEVTLTLYLSDTLNPSHTTSSSITVTDYEEHTFSVSPVYNQWRLAVTATGAVSDSLDDVVIELVYANAKINDQSVPLNGCIITRNYTIANPTGFRCKPVIRVIGRGLPISYVTTGEDLNSGEQWSMAWNLDASIVPDEYFMDCENEYIYYVKDGIRVNLTNYISIVHYSENGNEIPVSFPAMGEDYTTIVFGSTAGIILLYPHWYTI